MSGIGPDDQEATPEKENRLLENSRDNRPSGSDAALVLHGPLKQHDGDEITMSTSDIDSTLEPQEPLKNPDVNNEQLVQSRAQTVSGKSSIEIADYIDSLREPYSRAIRLHYLEGYSYPDIAKELQMPIGTIKAQISRGMKELKSLSKNAGSTQDSELSTRATSRNMQVDITAYLDKLQEPYLSAVRLHYLEKLSYPEIAQRLLRPIGTIKSYINRGMRMLRSFATEELD